MELVFVICPGVVCTASPVTPWAAVVFPQLCLPSGTDPGTLPSWCFVTVVVWSGVVVHHTDLLPICSLVFAVATCRLACSTFAQQSSDSFTRASFVLSARRASRIMISSWLVTTVEKGVDGATWF